MSSRDAILGRIRAAVADDPPRERPPAPEVWPPQNPTVEEMAERFAQELDALGGELYRLPSMEEAGTKLAELVDAAGFSAVGSVDRPLCRELASKLGPDAIQWIEEDASTPAMSELDAVLIEADYLLADTGTAMIACGTPGERVACYLPPVSIVIVGTDRLIEHMPAAWEQVARRCAEPELRGEFVFISGPSRTADIEKILILGVHGPKRLVVILVG